MPPYVIIHIMVQQHIQKSLKQALIDSSCQAVDIDIEIPNAQFGDYSSSVALKLAKVMQVDPYQLAQKIVHHLPTDQIIKKIEVIRPGFINFWLNEEFLMNRLAQQQEEGVTLVNPAHANKKVIVEYSSPNIAKPFTIGHLRSTIIGDAIANLLDASGFVVLRDNHIGDWGTQFGKQIYAIKTWGDEKSIDQSDRPVKLLVDLYVKFHQEAEKNPDLENDARAWFKKLEDGDEEARRLWRKCIDWSWKEFDAIYQRLGVKFTENGGKGYGESFFEDKMNDVIDQLRQKKLLSESQGAQIVFFADSLYPPLMIIKQDGATLYSTRDLATDLFRKRQYGDDIQIINEVGIEQSLYFKQLFHVEKLLGWFTESQRIHIKHGHYRFKDQKMSTRKGNVIWLEDVLNEAVQKAAQLGQTDSANAEKIAIGAIKWSDLKRNSQQDIIFDWNEMINLQGNSGPYIQYAYVRCQSLLQKNDHLDHQDSKLTHELSNMTSEELLLMRHLNKYRDYIDIAVEQLAPHHLCNYLFELAQLFNSFYQTSSILQSAGAERKRRILITQSTAQIIHSGLNILGIETVEKM